VSIEAGRCEAIDVAGDEAEGVESGSRGIWDVVED
jgi:hypothetical protein